MRKAAFVLFVLAFALPLMAGDPFNTAPAPKPHKFWDKTNIVLQTFNAAAQAADLITTEQDLQNPHLREANPVLQSAAARYGFKFAAVGLSLTASYAAYRTGHYRLARAIPIVLGAPSAVAAAHNATLR